MIKKLKTRFIILAMTSLVVLLAVIVAGMNIVNYNKVVRDADTRLDVLEENADRLLDTRGRDGGFGDSKPRFGDGDDFDGPFFSGRGKGGPSMSVDEAEESRFFTVTVDEDGTIIQTNTGRISAVDDDEAESFAQKALASGREKGFIEEFRFDVDSSDGDFTNITFLDCGRVLESFRDFLRYSILMSLLGLAVMFGVITYFAGRIVRPVAESYDKQKRFITDAGHEIKTPLAIIKANIDLMDMEIDGAAEGGDNAPSITVDEANSLRENLADMNDQVDRLTDLTNDLVYLSRMEEADGSLVMTEVPLSDIVSETVSSFEPLAVGRGLSIDTDITPMITVRGSHKELEKLLSIVLENAVKYSAVTAEKSSDEDPAEDHDSPGIGVSLKKEGKGALIEVRNETDGELTNESLSHVFDRFYRMDSSRNSETGGHGIGLSMAQAIAGAHGGKISARTSNGHDFIITVFLPL